MLIHPSREIRYNCSKPKGEIHEPKYLHTKFSQSDNNSRVPTCSRVQYTFSASVPVSTATSVPDFTNKLQQSKQRKSYLTCLWQHTTVQIPVKNMKTNSQQSFLFRFKFSSKQFPLPTQFRSFPMTYLFQSNAITTAIQNWHPWLPDASEKSKLTFPNRQTKFTLVMLTHSPLSTNNLNTKFHCAFSAMTVPISLSLSTPVYTLPGKPQCFRLQSQGHQSVQTSVKPHCSCTLPNLRCSTTHVLSQKHVATKPRSLTKQIRPSRFSCQRFSNVATKPRSPTLQALMPTFLKYGN